MKKLLIPILTTATIAPVATSMVACSSTINLKFNEEVLGENPGFVVENFSVKANKVYKFVADFSKATDRAIKDFGSNPISFAAMVVINDEPVELVPIVKSKVKVLLNDKDITSDIEYAEQGKVIAITKKDVAWKKTDKIVVTVAWSVSKDKLLVGVAGK